MKLRAANLVVATAIAGACSGCTYDFDGAFAGAGGGGGEPPSVGGGGSEPGVGGAGGSGGSGGSGGNANGELCFNGTDDDDDGLADCADPDCRAATCAPAAPAGWSGPASLTAGADDAPRGCPETLTPVAGGSGALSAPPATCAACSCGAPSGGVCGVGSTILYASNNVCSGEIETVVEPLTPNDCHTFSISDPSTQAFGEVVPVDTPGSCPPAGGGETVSPATFAEPALLCTDSAGVGCGDQVCVPAADEPLTQICVFADGDVACPAGPYSVKTVVFTGIDDTRGCTPCACSSATAESCGGTTNLFTNSNCNGTPVIVPHDGSTCESFDDLFPGASAMFMPAGGPTGGSCAPTGGSAKGMATASAPVTVCCQP